MSKPYEHERLTLASWAAAESCQPSGKVVLSSAVKAALAAADKHDEAMGIKRISLDDQLAENVRRVLARGAYQVSFGELPYEAQARAVVAMLEAVDA